MMNQSYEYSCRQGRNGNSRMQVQQASPSVRTMPAVPCAQMTQDQLLEWISLTKFACVDASLYLDTHPDDEEAIRYFQDYNLLYVKAMNEYARIYGPLTIAHAQHCCTYWDWVNQPWPWQ